MKKNKTLLIVIGVILALWGAFLALNTEKGKLFYYEVTGEWPSWDIETIPLHVIKFTVPYGEEGSDTSILVIRQDGLFGFGDAAGNILIKPQFQDARPFCEGLAAVKKGGKWGYIDSTGNTVIPFQFPDASDFHEGKAFVAVEYVVQGRGRRPKCGVINRQGRLVKQHTDVSCLISFHDGVYFTIPSGALFPRYVDADGSAIFAHMEDGEKVPISGYNDGMYRCGRWRDYECFFVRVGGSTILAGDFSDASDFSEGFAAVDSKDRKGWGYIDHNGTYVIEPQFMRAEPFSDGLAWVQDKKTGNFQVIDKTGKKVCDAPPEHMVRGLFSEGMCAMRKSVGTFDKDGYKMYWGFMDTSGKMVIPCKFQEVSSFHNGIAQVWIDGKMGYIDKSGNYIWEPK